MLSNWLRLKKGSRIFYDTFAEVDKYNPNGKWQTEIGDINENEWKSYFLNIKNWHEVKIRDFQYKINNKILVTNSFLSKINKIESDACTYCKEQPEKIDHLFLRCPKIRQFWNELRTWLYTNVKVELSLEDRKILFSFDGKNELVNYIYVLAKFYIYQNKFMFSEH